MPTIHEEADLLAQQRAEKERRERQHAERAKNPPFEALLARVQPYLDGQQEAPNEMAAYLVEQLRDAHAERNAVLQNLAEIDRQGRLMQRRRIELEGTVRQYMKDLDHWVERDAGEPSEQPDTA